MKYETAVDISGRHLYDILDKLSRRINFTTDELGKLKRCDRSRDKDIDAIIINSSYDEYEKTLRIVHVFIYRNGDTLYVREENNCQKDDMPEGTILARNETVCDSCYVKEICHATSKFPIIAIKNKNMAIWDVLNNMIDEMVEQTKSVELSV